jgi:hypothetical protein
MVTLGLPQGALEWIGANPERLFFAVLLGGFALIGGAVLWHWRQVVRSGQLVSRVPGSRAFLRERGWSLVPWGSITWTRPLAVRPLSGSPEQIVTDFAWGVSDGVVCAAFVAQIAGGVKFAIEMADLPRPLPPLVLCPAVYDVGITALPSAHPFLSESVDFNANWVVRAQDARYASSILTPRFMERLLKDDASDMWLIIDGGALMTITNGGVVPNDRIAAHLTVLRDLISLITPATYADFATGAPGTSWRWASSGPGCSWWFLGRSGSFG